MRLLALIILLAFASSKSATAEIFETLPSLDEIAASYPEAAKAGNLGGRVVLHCVRRGQAVTGCAVAMEGPAGYGFGAAAMTLLEKVRLAESYVSPSVDGPVEYLPPRALTVKFKMDKTYGTTGAGPYYPVKAYDAGATGGALLACSRGRDGVLDACRVLGEGPSGMDFGGAALRAAKAGWIKVQSRQGNGPADLGEPVLVLVPFGFSKR
ncbi:hypothetical protein [Phenylobacterium immobile]|uniref:hypothetical protein n=1 Tax=Phenylobacterium immobile TaxID=21 RepID=UPI000A8FD5B9|nr:hypothetical protein [Phenylobacterium immobile]